MPVITHAKSNTLTDWTQAQLDAQIALGNFPAGTTLADIVLPSDWNAGHVIAESQTNLTADTTLTTNDSGKIFTNIGASGLVIVTIPAVVLFNATFIVTVAQEFRIKADTGDIIYDGNLASAAGGYIKSDKIGSVLEIYCTDSTNIFVRNAKGDWRIN
jgi:hypothetical protein